MENNSKIYIAGHNGLVGSEIYKALEKNSFSNLIHRSHKELDLTDYIATEKFFKSEKPEYVFLAAAKVGGILGNDNHPAEMIYQNLAIQNNVIHLSYKYNVKKLLFLGSSCIYPRLSKQPMKEEYLLTGPLEPTNEPYAIAKIAGIKMCQSYNRQYGTNFIACMPTNLYGPNDNFDPENSHVFPALIKKITDAKINNLPEIVMWGSGNPKREFLHAQDMAEGCLYLMNNFNPNQSQNKSGDIFINIGSGREISIRELVVLIKEIIGYQGKIVNDLSKPDGTPRKLLDGSKMEKLGWKPKISLEDGIKQTHEIYLRNYIK